MWAHGTLHFTVKAREYRGGGELRAAHQSREKLDTGQHEGDEMGPIRIRNLEDLIR